MLPRQKLRPETIKRIDELKKQFDREARTVMLKSSGLTVAGVVPIAILAHALSINGTPFPMVAGLITVVSIQFGFVRPRAKELVQKYQKLTLEVLDAEREQG